MTGIALTTETPGKISRGEVFFHWWQFQIAFAGKSARKRGQLAALLAGV
ncbi:MAG: hypothetical protein NT105_09050 [Verrucomicrobia bacterium]|nr:hypothetical protein [Verrucomicrobiota bacterium]